MARYSLALLPLLLLAGVLVHSCYGSRSSPGERLKPGVLSPVLHGATEPRRRDDGSLSTEPRVAVATSAPGGAGAGAGAGRPELRDGRAVAHAQHALRAVPIQKLARRVLQGGLTEDSAAGSSCRSHDVHITCPPPALH